MKEIESKISLLIQEQQPITESEAQDLAHSICELLQPRISQTDRTLVAHIKDNEITLQKSDYVEDGNLIKINGNKIELYEIPYGGGTEIYIGEFDTIIEAIAKGNTLT